MFPTKIKTYLTIQCKFTIIWNTDSRVTVTLKITAIRWYRLITSGGRIAPINRLDGTSPICATYKLLNIGHTVYNIHHTDIIVHNKLLKNYNAL